MVRIAEVEIRRDALGKGNKILLVSSLVLDLSLATTAGVCPAIAETRAVDAADYRSYWLWAGVRRRPEIASAQTIYLLQGEIALDDRGERVIVKAQGGSQPAPHPQDLWIVYRVGALAWSPEVYASLLRKYSSWKSVPGKVVGVQIDFDARTRDLASYANFLKTLRQQLPADCKLSVTGLMDWAANASAEELNELSGTIDEIIFQTYKKDRTVDDIDKYLRKMERLRLPFKIGLAEGALWDLSAPIARHPYFRGYVVFLRNAPARERP
jgi:hypothetical protein